MRNRMYGGVRGRKMKVGGNYFIFLLLDFLNTFFAVIFWWNDFFAVTLHPDNTNITENVRNSRIYW